MFRKESLGYLIASVCWMVAGIAMIIGNQMLSGISFVGLGIIFFMLTLLVKKKKNIDFTLVASDEIFNTFVAEGKKIKAVKRCRSIVNCGLKEASDYVESIIETIK